MRNVWSIFSLLALLVLVACQSASVVEKDIATETAVPPSRTLTPLATDTLQPIDSQITAVSPSVTPTPTQVAVTPTPPPLAYLDAAITRELADFTGLSSYVIRDLTTGEEISHEPDLAIAGMSLIKIPILINTYRVLSSPPDIEQTKLITQTTALSSNYAANLLLQIIARQPNAYIGAEIVTDSMRDLGMYNTFMVAPYDAEAKPGWAQTYLTPANQRTDITTHPDIYRQTTTGDLAQLLQMLYDCAEKDQGLLRTTYPNELTQAECQQMLQMLQLNELVKLLEAGLPKDITTIAHKIGYIDDTYGDAAIVYSPNRDYILVLALYYPNWLEWQVASPLFARISQLTYDHFNDPHAYSAATLAAPPPLLPTATPPPTPDLPQAIVTGTSGIGLTLRTAPAGAELTILPEGSVISLLDTAPTTHNGIAWRNVRTPDGLEGWVGADYLTTQN